MFAEKKHLQLGLHAPNPYRALRTDGHRPIAMPGKSDQFCPRFPSHNSPSCFLSWLGSILKYLEDHPSYHHGWFSSPKDQVSYRPPRIGLFSDPFQMAYINGLEMGVILTTYDTWMILQVPSLKTKSLPPGGRVAKRRATTSSNPQWFRCDGC